MYVGGKLYQALKLTFQLWVDADMSTLMRKRCAVHRPWTLFVDCVMILTRYS